MENNDKAVNPEPLKEFFAVTETSVYRVTMEDSLPAVATKISLRGSSRVAVGEKFSGPMLAICNQLITYIPEGGGLTSFQRNIESVNTRWWTGNSSPIVALFKDEKSALECSSQKDLKPCDERCLKETIEVLRAIGESHPAFSICSYPGLRLLDPELWK